MRCGDRLSKVVMMTMIEFVNKKFSYWRNTNNMYIRLGREEMRNAFDELNFEFDLI